MPSFDPKSLSSMSDEDLLKLELDESIPIEDWMKVERERGRREERRKRDEARAAAGLGGAASNPAGRSAADAAREANEDYRVRDALAQLRALLVPGETLAAYAVQRRLFALTHRRLVVCATSGRFISLSRGLFGGYVPWDVRWQDLEDASISAGIFGATLTITSLATEDMASRGNVGRVARIPGLRTEQAQRVYTLCQAQEQAWREKRRVRDLDELRAQSGGVQIGGAVPGGAAAGLAAAAADPTERLHKAKQMLDEGLITDAEYESIKARVVDGL